MPNGKDLFDRIALKPILGLFAIRVENIAMSLPMSGIISHHSMPLILNKGFQLDSKRKDFLAVGHMIMSISAYPSFWIKVNEKLALSHGRYYTSPAERIIWSPGAFTNEPATDCRSFAENTGCILVEAWVVYKWGHENPSSVGDFDPAEVIDRRSELAWGSVERVSNI